MSKIAGLRTHLISSFFFLLQWALQIDASQMQNYRLAVRKRKSVGAFDAVVNSYGSMPECTQGPRAFAASVCQVVFKHLRIGIPSLTAAMLKTPREIWTDKPFRKTVGDYLGKNGPQYKQAYTVMQAMRAHNNHGAAVPLDDEPIAKFCISVLNRSTDLCWSEAGSSGSKDKKNAAYLCERFYTMIPRTGAAWKWLINGDVYSSMREDFGGLFSFEQGVPFKFPDGIVARPNYPYVSIAANTTASGTGSMANIHVLEAESEHVQVNSQSKMVQLRDLINELGGVRGTDGAMYLPTPIYHASRTLLPVRPRVTVPFPLSLASLTFP